MRKVGEMVVTKAGRPPVITETGGDMVMLRALRPLRGDWGTAHPGHTFETAESVARDLESRGLVERVHPVRDSLKAMFVPENKSAVSAQVPKKPPKVAPARNKRKKK